MLISKDGEGAPTHIKLKKAGISPEAVKRLVPYLKKGQYQSIEFKTRDGQLIHYERTEVVKLKADEKKDRSGRKSKGMSKTK